MKTDENQLQEITVPLGKALKDARLAASLSTKEVAEKLNLSLSLVRELEDELDDILETRRYPVIYLRGYLVNYSKLLGLTTLELFVEYQQLDLIQKQDKVLRAPRLIIPATKKRSKILPLSLLVIIAIITIVYIFQKQLFNTLDQVNWFSERLPHSLTSASERRELSISNLLQTSVSSVTDAENSVATEAKVATPKVIEKLAEIEPQKTKIVNLIESVIEINTQITKHLDSEQSQPTVEENVDVIKTTQLSAENASDDVVAIKLATESLKLSFSADCWTEIFDATGTRIAFGLYKSGRVLMLSGIAPFQLKLGEPSVVEIQYQTQIIEGDYTPGRSVQFSVPLS